MKDIGFTGVFRLIFRPLVEELPCFGAVCFSLRKKVLFPIYLFSFSLIIQVVSSFISFLPLKSSQKKLDFRLKVIGGEISAIPGISDALEVWQYIFVLMAESWGFIFSIIDA